VICRYLVARCTDTECGWMELPDKRLTDREQEAQLRQRAARHTSNVAATLVRPLG